MASVVHIDVPWLLQRHEEVLPDQPTINDFSALVAAVARHRVDPPRLGVDSDPAWRAAALLHTLALLKPLPAANARFACATAVAYMFVSGVGIDPPYGALVDLARDLISGKTDVYGAADRLRSWQICGRPAQISGRPAVPGAADRGREERGRRPGFRAGEPPSHAGPPRRAASSGLPVAARGERAWRSGACAGFTRGAWNVESRCERTQLRLPLTIFQLARMLLGCPCWP
jgi:prophage maintenance system killer protein